MTDPLIGTQQVIDQEHEPWESIRSTLDEYINSEYVNIDKLVKFVVDECLKELEYIPWFKIAQDVYDLVIPLPSGYGIGHLIPDRELVPFANDLERAFKEDYIYYICSKN